jgi:short-subunit dehydrogenase
MTKGTWLILGASSSIARAFARASAADGFGVMLAGRDLDDLERTAADIRVRAGVAAGIADFDARAFDTHGRFAAKMASDIAGPLHLFLAFGAMPEQEAMDRDFRLAREAIETNYLGVVSLLSAFAPIVEGRGQGHIVALSSVAGDRGRLKNYIYGSAKAGMSAYLQGLRARLFRSGVTVTTVKPGFVDTAMTFGRPGMFLVARPEALADACLKAGLAGRETLYFPWFWRVIMTLICAIPERVFKKLNI